MCGAARPAGTPCHIVRRAPWWDGGTRMHACMHAWSSHSLFLSRGGAAAWVCIEIANGERQQQQQQQRQLQQQQRSSSAQWVGLEQHQPPRPPACPASLHPTSLHNPYMQLQRLALHHQCY